MKKHYVFIALATALVAVNANAQISITPSQIPVAGDAFIMVDANETTLSFAKSGTNQTWDLTALTEKANSGDTTWFYAPAGTPGTAFFPTATLASLNGVNGEYGYYFANSSVIDQLGVFGDPFKLGNNVPLVFSPSLTYLDLPFTYGSSSHGKGTVVLKEKGSAFGQPVDSIKYAHTVEMTRNATAWGTLQLSAGNHSAILTKLIEVNVDTAWMKDPIVTGGQWVIVPNSAKTKTDSAYEWLTDKSVTPYAKVKYSSGSINYIGMLKTTGTVGLAESRKLNNVSIYPNPISTYAIVNVNAGLVGNKTLAFVVYDVTGREVSRTSVTSAQFLFGKGNLVQGNYIYNLVDSNSVISSGKLVIAE